MKFFKVFILVGLCTLALCSCGDKQGGSSGGGESTSSVFVQQSDFAEEVKVTFPEGWTVMQYARRLEEKGVCTKDEFYSAVNDIDYSDSYSFLPEKEILAQRPYKLEGYLFPDTYFFGTDESAESIVRKMLNNFESRVAKIYAENAGDNGLTFDETITLASIVERETPVAEEMPKIAGVFINRLKSPDYPKLQSDATKRYPYESYNAIPEDIREEFVSEYNTYNVEGLPKGAICNPSINAIKGSFLHDESVEAYFFYTDVNNKHYYAVTYDEHLTNYQYCIDNDLVP